MTSKWGSSTTFKFVEEYRKQRCLWDPQDKEHRSKEARNAALERIVRRMNIKGFDLQAARKKVRTIRSTYWNEKSKYLRSIASGTTIEPPHKPKLHWYSLADEFLKVTVTTWESSNHANMKNEEADEDDTAMSTKGKYPDETYEETCIEPIQEIKTEESTEAEDKEMKSEHHTLPALNGNDAHAEDDVDLPTTSIPLRALNGKLADGGTGLDLLNSCKMEEMLKRNVASFSAENEFDLFGRIVACHLKKLPQREALEIEKEILHLILTRRLNHVLSLTTTNE